MVIYTVLHFILCNAIMVAPINTYVLMLFLRVDKSSYCVFVDLFGI